MKPYDGALSPSGADGLGLLTVTKTVRRLQTGMMYILYITSLREFWCMLEVERNGAR